MSTTKAPPEHASSEPIPIWVKIILPCVAVCLILFVAFFLSSRHCKMCRRCCGEKKERDPTYALLGPPSTSPDYPLRTFPQLPVPPGTNPSQKGGDESERGGGSFQQDGAQPSHLDTQTHVLGDNSRFGHSSPNSDIYSQHGRCIPPRSVDPRMQNGDEETLPTGTATEEVQPFKPGQKGYISMSSSDGRILRRCRPKNGYITARPEHNQKPVQVCHPLTKSMEPLNIQEVGLASQPRYEDQFQLNNPIYERLDRYRRPSRRTNRRVESCPSSRLHRTNRGHYDSLPQLRSQLSTVEIPIGPFVSYSKREPKLSDTEDMIKNRKSFEDLFSGAWWHSGSEEEESSDSECPPRLPEKQRRYRTSLPPANTTRERPVSYVLMNHQNRHLAGNCETVESSQGATTLPAFSRRHDSYMTHGQMMRFGKAHAEDTCVTREDHLSLSVIPPRPCGPSHVYVNAKDARCQ